MRFLAFLILFVIFVAVTAPLEKLIAPWLSRLNPYGVDVRIGSARLSLPAGLRVTELQAEGTDFDVDLDSVYFGIDRSFDVAACGGTMRGHVRGDALAVQVHSFDPSRCLRIGQITLESPIDGTIEVDGVSLLDLRLRPDSRARIDLHSAGGIFGGHVPMMGPEGPTLMPVGDWEFGDIALRGTFEAGRLRVEQGHALTSGVRWELTGATLGRSNELRIDFRARMVEDTPRAKTLIALLPPATADSEGWRRYRVVTADGAPKLLGLE